MATDHPGVDLRSRVAGLMLTDAGRDRLTAIGLFLALMIIYNANGREIGSYDTQPTKFAARELLLRGTLTLNHVVAETPAYAERGGFFHAADGNYRSAYSPVSSVAAAVVVWPLWRTGLIDIRAPLAPALIAKLAASVLISVAVVLAFFTARQRLSRRRALLLALGLGLGTGFWSTSSQTLWQTTTASVGLAVAVFALAAPRPVIGVWKAVAIGLGLGLAGTARPQVAPIVALLLAGTCVRSTRQAAGAAVTLVALSAAALCALNLRWFGHPLGALVMLQDVNSQVHGTGATFGIHPEGFLGLLLSPSRGLLIFSPIVLVAVAGCRQSFAEGWRSPLRWCVLALAAEYAIYGSFAVWWGGHTYGPRYLLDILPVAVPVAAVRMARPQITARAKNAAMAALAWSVLVAATGAFCYPHDRWNVAPSNVDRNHSRLWAIVDNQIARCWVFGLSPQNFALFDRAAVRQTRQ